MAPKVFTLHQKFPDEPEAAASGPFQAAIKRGTPEFKALVKNVNPDIIFKNEEGKDDDQIMTSKLSARVDALAVLVKQEFPGLKLRVTEAWDDSTIHAPTSRHLEGRAVDITTSDVDRHKLGRLAGLAAEAGFDWVFFENDLHVHASVKK
jgi:hypothetical protein